MRTALVFSFLVLIGTHGGHVLAGEPFELGDASTLVVHAAPESRLVVYLTNIDAASGDLWLLDTVSGDRASVKERVRRDFKWSPDRSLFLATDARDEGRVVAVDLASRRATEVVENAGRWIVDPTFTKVLWEIDRSRKRTGPSLKLFDLPQNRAIPLLTNETAKRWLLTKDWKWMAVRTENKLLLSDLDNPPLVIVEEYSAGPFALSPDGRFVVYVGGSRSNELMLWDASERSAKKIDQTSGGSFDLERLYFDATGDLLFYAVRGRNQPETRIRNMRDGTVEKMGGTLPVYGFMLDSTTGTVDFQRGAALEQEGGLWWWRPGSRRLDKIGPLVEGPWVRSPDGRYVVFKGAADEQGGRSDLFLLDLARGNAARLGATSSPVDQNARFSDDSRRVFFETEGRDGTRYLAFSDTRKPKTVIYRKLGEEGGKAPLLCPGRSRETFLYAAERVFWFSRTGDKPRNLGASSGFDCTAVVASERRSRRLVSLGKKLLLLEGERDKKTLTRKLVGFGVISPGESAWYTEALPDGRARVHIYDLDRKKDIVVTDGAAPYASGSSGLGVVAYVEVDSDCLGKLRCRGRGLVRGPRDREARVIAESIDAPGTAERPPLRVVGGYFEMLRGGRLQLAPLPR